MKGRGSSRRKSRPANAPARAPSNHRRCLLVSVFYGIVVSLNFFDHAPPHLHAAYGGNEALFDIRTGRMIVGKLPRRQTRYVVEWIVKNRIELMRDWDLAVAGRPTFRLAGLEDE